MAGKNTYNNEDSMDINELAALNQDISDDLIEQLQQQVEISSNEFSRKTSGKKPSVEKNLTEDGALFEEPVQQEPIVQEPVVQEAATQEVTAQKTDNAETSEKETAPAQEIPAEEKKENPETGSHKAKVDASALSEGFDDNFIKKYKAKLQKQAKIGNAAEENYELMERSSKTENSNTNNIIDPNSPIEELSQGNISEKEYTDDQKAYAESLDLLDGNVKYSKYVIYIDPQNVDFIEGLTVKERKNLINTILRQQDDISITKHRFKVIQTVINHIIIAILTIAISIPAVYYVVNASLEATVNNYRRSQTNFQTLYREKGKITNNN